MRCPPIVDLSYRQTTADRALDLRVEQTRLNLAAPFLLQLGRTVMDAMPGYIMTIKPIIRAISKD